MKNGGRCACHPADSATVMTHTHTELLRYVRSHWSHWQCRVAARYFQRVTVPLRFWVALGRPQQFRPQLPWWQPFVWQWLVLTGWVRPSRRRHRPL